VLEAVTRLVPGVVGREESVARDSFAESEPGLLDHPHYTRPQELRGMAVPDVLVSGHHGEVERWRREAALAKTRSNRPDLLSGREEGEMVDRAAVEDWLGRYVQAWNSNDPQEIGALFTEDADYFTAPYRGPWHGRETIVREWLDRKDDSGTWTFEHEVLGVDGDRAFVRGFTRYTSPDDPDPGPFSNLWVIDLTREGRAARFVEWWMVAED
jgi:ketosteroid isomerase-like protein